MKIKNNPLNIKYKPCNNWQGQLKPLKGYCRFKAVEYGFRAGVVTYFRLKNLDNLSFMSFVYALYGDNDEKRYKEYVVNIVEMCNFLNSAKFEIYDEIPIFYLPAVLRRLASLEQGYNDIHWNSILVNVVCTYMLKCGMIDDCTKMMFY